MSMLESIFDQETDSLSGNEENAEDSASEEDNFIRVSAVTLTKIHSS